MNILVRGLENARKNLLNVIFSQLQSFELILEIFSTRKSISQNTINCIIATAIPSGIYHVLVNVNCRIVTMLHGICHVPVVDDMCNTRSKFELNENVVKKFTQRAFIYIICIYMYSNGLHLLWFLI